MKKRILIGYYSNIGVGGIDKYLDNVIESIYQEDVQIDCLTSNLTDELINKLKKRNVNIYKINRLIKPIQRYQETADIVKKNHYDIAYFNISECFNCICNFAVRKNSKATIITHSHSSGNDNANKIKRTILKWIHYFMRPFLMKNTDYFYSCSETASNWMFGKNFLQNNHYRIIQNTVDSKKFIFNLEYRYFVRSDLGFDEKDVVVGFVGHLEYQKNVLYLLDAFNEMGKHNNRYKLLMIGQGSLFHELKQKCKEYNIEDRVIFTGTIKDVYRYYSAMDLFVFPSNFEGLGIVGLEAQINGLHCCFSNHVPKEVQICDNVSFHSINQSAMDFAKEIMQQDISRKNSPNFFENVCYDINDQKEEFKKIFVQNMF